jgi:hypothetical protein
MDEDAPLRLAVAAEMAFPGGGMTRAAFAERLTRAASSSNALRARITRRSAQSRTCGSCLVIPKTGPLATVRRDDAQELARAKLQKLRQQAK